jgi:hypothetical protein
MAIISNYRAQLKDGAELRAEAYVRGTALRDRLGKFVVWRTQLKAFRQAKMANFAIVEQTSRLLLPLAWRAQNKCS